MTHKIKKSLLFIIVVLIFSVEAFSQSNFNINTTLPTSPEAAILGRFGDIPVGHYTGVADISIPIYTIKESGLEVPITLRYHGSGIKVEDQASNVGLGWSMEPGGAIIQVINGAEDKIVEIVGTGTSDAGYGFADGYEYLKGYLTNTSSHWSRYARFDKVFPCTTSDVTAEGDSREVLELIMAGGGQPDIYQYHFPGGFSGKFFINPETLTPVLLDKSNEIQFSSINDSTWTARTLDGSLYTFGAMEHTNAAGSAQEYTGRTWKLTRILLPNKKVIRFTYKRGYNEWFFYNESYHSGYPLSIPSYNDYQTPYSNMTWNETKNLDSIITSDVHIKFNMEDRHDMLGMADVDGISDNGSKSVKRVKSIDIKDPLSGQKIKTFNFGYSYFSYNTIGGSYTDATGVPAYSTTWNLTDSVAILGKRLKLTTLQEIGYTSGNVPVNLSPHQFEYDESVTMPLKTSYSRDYWGYYNGKSNTKMLPKLSASEFGYLTYPADLKDTLDIRGGNRSVDTLYTGAYLLKKIIYPTGGFTEFDYQVHHFEDPIYFGAGMRVSAIRNYTGAGVLASDKRIKYLLSNGSSSGLLMSPLAFAYSRNLNFQRLVPSLASVNQDVWYVSSESFVPFSSSAAGQAVGYTRVIEEDYLSTSNVNGRKIFSYHNFVSDTEPHMPDVPDLLNGKILKEEVYNSSNTLLQETNYQYSNLQTSIFSGVKAFQNFYHYNVPCDPISGPVYYSNAYEYIFYPLRSDWWVLSKKQTKNYDGANLAINWQSYTYNSKGQLSAQLDTNSRIQPLLSTFTYTIDVGGTLQDSLLYDKLIEKRDYVDGTEVLRITNTYAIEDSQVILRSVTRSNNAGATTYTEVDFDDYGPNQSLLQFTIDGLKTALIWTDQHTVPIAEVKNATSAEVAYTSFEGNDTGGWSFNPAGLTNTNSQSGFMAYIVSGTTSVSKSGLNPGTSYIVSYWTTKSSAYSISGTISTNVRMTVGSWKLIEHEVTGVNSVLISGTESLIVDDLRLYPKGALMTTYTHSPLIGLSSQTDAKGHITRYEYDEHSRLKNIRDENGFIVKTYEYHYKQ